MFKKYVFFVLVIAMSCSILKSNAEFTTDLGSLQLRYDNDAAVSEQIEKNIQEVANTKSNVEHSVKNAVTNVKSEAENYMVPASSSDSSAENEYSFTKGNVTTSKDGSKYTFTPSSGVNDSKTIYTDDLGRLHFFGKGSMIREQQVRF